MTKPAEPTILDRLSDECFVRPIAASNYGHSGKVFSRFMSKADDDLSVWGRLKAKEAGE